MLALDRKHGQRVHIQTHDTLITVSSSSDGLLFFDAPQGARIHREEISRVCEACERVVRKGEACPWCALGAGASADGEGGAS